jgi:hypothetical protein
VWARFAKIEDHHLRPQAACVLHGTQCVANQIIQAWVDLGFDLFA